MTAADTDARQGFTQNLLSLVPSFRADQLAADGADDPFIQNDLSPLIKDAVELEKDINARSMYVAHLFTRIYEYADPHVRKPELEHWIRDEFKLGYRVFILLSWFFNIVLFLATRWWTSPHMVSSNAKHQLLMRLLRRILCYRRLEMYARYGDYLAQRLAVVRKKLPESNADPDRYWTSVSQSLDREGQDEAGGQPWHENLKRAIIELQKDDPPWELEDLVFMVHEYGKRNSLMHANLAYLVAQHDWQQFGALSTQDLKALEGMTDKNAERWRKMIRDYRDRFVEADAEGNIWRPRPIIRDAMAAGLVEADSLCRLAANPNTTIEMIKAERADAEARSRKANADAKENRVLKKQVQQLEQKLEVITEGLIIGGHADIVASLVNEQAAKAKLEDELKKERTKLANSQEALKQEQTKNRRVNKDLREEVATLQLSWAIDRYQE